MMKLVYLLALVSVAYAALERFPQEEKPVEFANQEGCYISSLNRVLPYDVPYYPGDKCNQYVCQNSNETILESCVAVFINPGCTKSPDDLTKNYPECCGTQVCPSTAAPLHPEPKVLPPTQVPIDGPTEAPTRPTQTRAPTAPAAPISQGCFAYASAKSISGQAPVTETYTSGADAQASATAF